MNYQRGFVSLAVLLMIVLGVAVVGGGAYFVLQQNPASQTTVKSPSMSPSTSPKSAIEALSLSYPLLTYRINTIEHKGARLRIIDVPSGLALWDDTEIAIGTHEIDLARLVRYEDVKISLPAGTYRLRLEVFIGGIGKTLAESDTFTVPGTVVAVPTCTIRLDGATLTWASQNADEAYIAHSPGMGGSSIMLGLNKGKKVLSNGSETVTWDGAAEESWLVVKNSRGATVCYPDGTTYFNSQKEIDNPPTIG